MVRRLRNMERSHSGQCGVGRIFGLIHHSLRTRPHVRRIHVNFSIVEKLLGKRTKTVELKKTESANKNIFQHTKEFGMRAALALRA